MHCNVLYFPTKFFQESKCTCWGILYAELGSAQLELVLCMIWQILSWITNNITWYNTLQYTIWHEKYINESYNMGILKKVKRNTFIHFGCYKLDCKASNVIVPICCSIWQQIETKLKNNLHHMWLSLRTTKLYWYYVTVKFDWLI